MDRLWSAPCFSLEAASPPPEHRIYAERYKAMKKSLKVSLLGTVALTLPLGATGFAEIKSEEFSVSSVSPAQRYNHETGTSGSAAYEVNTIELGDLRELDATISTVQATGHYKLPVPGFAGLGVAIGNASSKYKTLTILPTEELQSSEDKVEETIYNFKPYFGWNLTPNASIVYELNAQRTEGEDDDATSLYHKLAAIYHNDLLELGAVYQHQVDTDDDQEPQHFLVHGQGRVHDQVVLGAQYTFSKYDVLDGYESEDNQHSIKLTSGLQVNDRWLLEAALTALAIGNEEYSGYGSEFGASYALNDKLKLGGIVYYANISGELDTDTDTITLQGSGETYDVSTVEGENYGMMINASYSF